MTLDCNEVHLARILLTRIVNAIKKKKLLPLHGLFLQQFFLQVVQPGGDQNNQQKASGGAMNLETCGRSASTLRLMSLGGVALRATHEFVFLFDEQEYQH